MKHALTLLLTLAATIGPAGIAVGAPSDPTVRVTLECEGFASTIVVTHPGLGKAIWDITSGQISNGPDYHLKRIELTVYRNGTLWDAGVWSFGTKNGMDAVTCNQTAETWTDEAGNTFTAVGTTVLALK
jgi:hypothetical protein